MTRNTCAKAWATTARPRMATDSQTRSPMTKPAQYAAGPRRPRPVTRADDGLLDQVRGVFGDHHAGLGRDQHRDAARLAKLEGRGRVAIDEGCLDGGLVRAEFIDDTRQSVVDRDQALGKRELLVGL